MFLIEARRDLWGLCLRLNAEFNQHPMINQYEYIRIRRIQYIKLICI